MTVVLALVLAAVGGSLAGIAGGFIFRGRFSKQQKPLMANDALSEDAELIPQE